MRTTNSFIKRPPLNEQAATMSELNSPRYRTYSAIIKHYEKLTTEN
ncbi:34048_t:CDS:1, partial [Racocetra persica]